MRGNHLADAATQGMPASDKFRGDAVGVSINYLLCDEGNIIPTQWTHEIEDLIDQLPANLLNENCVKYLNYHENIDEVSVIKNDNLATFTLDNIERDVEGRLIVPIMWDSRTSLLLSKNYFLCKWLLQSNLHKLQKNHKCI